jgi:hypothetical protein
MQEEFITNLEMLHDYQFEISFDDAGLANVRSDEPVPVGNGEYPKRHPVSLRGGGQLPMRLPGLLPPKGPI